MINASQLDIEEQLMELWTVGRTGDGIVFNGGGGSSS